MLVKRLRAFPQTSLKGLIAAADWFTLARA
jgi:hypothetical protein